MDRGNFLKMQSAMPAGALRLKNADYEKTARAGGLDFTPGRVSPHATGEAGAPPGFLEYSGL